MFNRDTIYFMGHGFHMFSLLEAMWTFGFHITTEWFHHGWSQGSFARAKRQFLLFRYKCARESPSSGTVWPHLEIGIKSGACLGGMTSNPDGRSICWYQPGSTWIFLKVASFTQNLPEIWRAEIVYPYCRLRGPFFCTGEFHRNILYMYQLVMTNIAMENHHAINT